MLNGPAMARPSSASSSPPPAPGPQKELGAGAIIRRLLRDYVSGQWGLLAAAILSMLFAAAMGGAIPLLLNQIVKYIFIRHTAAMLAPLSLAVLGLMVARAAGQFFGRVTVDSLGEKTVATAQADMFESLISRDLADLNAVHSGQFVSNFLYDATLVRDALTNGITAIFLELVSLIFYLGNVFITDWQLAILALLALPGVAWAMERLGKSMRLAATRSMQETGDLSVVLSEAMGGRRIIKAYGLETHAMTRVQTRLAARLKTLLGAVRLRDAAMPLTDIFAGFVIAVVLFVAGWQNLHGQLSLNAFMGFLTALLLALQPVRTLSQYWPIASSGFAAANRMFDAIDTKATIVDAPGAKTLKVLRAPQGGAVRLKGLGFGYDNGGEAALSDIDLNIPPGAKVALVGPSGAGKSTIFNLLLRFYDPDSGSVSIDGTDIRDVTRASLRANIALVTQESILFDESVAQNIALGRPDASRADIERAAQDAAAHEFIIELPEGYDTRVGEGGLKLSGGQRQRIAIARAMLRNAPILLLDEATSALDTTSEARVQEALSRLMHDRTTIVIAHRLSTVRDADMIFVLDRGRVVESGSHTSLIEKSGLYAQLYSHNLSEAEPVAVPEKA
jgi:subfamily B ATP-binding cassette protein MsbA